MDTFLRLVQFQNADWPMLVTLEGIITLARPEQPEKADWPMLVTLEGIITLARPEQEENLQLVVGQWIPVKMVEK